MERSFSAFPKLLQPLRRTPLPPSTPVEEKRSKTTIPNHLLESKIYAKLKSNGLIQAEPPELHFSGFELGKDSIKILKVINISSEVMNIHVIPTQTKHFQTTYTKKYRLLPGFDYTLKVRLRPDEWRYFYDCIRVHCKGEENLLIPVHAYPVIDDLHIPPRIDLAAVPLGQSVCRAIPLRCSCPVDFEFQVCIIQPHEAFSIHPLTGVIPANGEENIIVSFSPSEYETCQVTIQVIISQFNSRPFLCTITGSTDPHITLSELARKPGHGDAAPAEYKAPSPASKLPRPTKTKHRRTKEADKTETQRDQAGVKPGSKPLFDVCTPAGVAKMLIKDTSKLNSKDLREAISCGSLAGLQNRQMKEALFLKKVQQNEKEEQANRRKWQVHLGQDPMSEHSRRQIVDERKIALQEYMIWLQVKRGEAMQEGVFAAGPPKLSRQVLNEVGQAYEGAPSFQFYPSFQFELKQRALRLFQQAARKIVIRCRMDRRLACFKQLSENIQSLPLATKVDEPVCDLPISPDKVFPFTFPVFSHEDDPLACRDSVTLPVDPIDVVVTTRVPFFKLQVPQRYKLMGYQPVSAWEAYTSYIPTTLARPLRGPSDKLEHTELGARSLLTVEPKVCEERPHEHKEEGGASLSYRAPDALLRPFTANPLRIFNPAPGLQTYAPTPKYLESDLDFHLCPFPRYSVPQSTMNGRETPDTQKFLDHRKGIPRLEMWKDFDSITPKCLSNYPAFTMDCAPRRSVDYNPDILPLAAPPPLSGPPDDLLPLMDEPCDDSGIQLTPQMIRAVFLSDKTLLSNLAERTTAMQQRELELEAFVRPWFNPMELRGTSRLQQLGVSDRTSPGKGSRHPHASK